GTRRPAPSRWSTPDRARRTQERPAALGPPAARRLSADRSPPPRIAQRLTTRRWARSARAHHGRGSVAARTGGAPARLRLSQPPGPIVTVPMAGGRRRAT